MYRRLNRNAPQQTRAIRKALGELPAQVSTMREFRDTRVLVAELEQATHARALLIAAGYSVTQVTSGCLGFSVYATPEL